MSDTTQNTGGDIQQNPAQQTLNTSAPQENSNSPSAKDVDTNSPNASLNASEQSILNQTPLAAKLAEVNSSAQSEAEAKAEEKHQEQLKHTAPIGIDYTNPADREKTLDEHRKENEENFQAKGTHFREIL